MDQKQGVILMNAGYPDELEKAFAGKAVGRGEQVRYVRFKFYNDPQVELESVHVAYSQHKHLLVPYQKAGIETELIPSGEGEGGATSSGLPSLPAGFSYQKAGPARWKLINNDGQQVGPTFYKKDAESFLSKHLPE